MNKKNASFDFGKNWLSFSRRALSQARIDAARKDFLLLFNSTPLVNKTFLDIGFGQGLACFFAQEAGADIYGCDINPLCKTALDETRRFFKGSRTFPLVIGSILSPQIQATLEHFAPDGFDIVHSWGVLHHTGDMESAIAVSAGLVRKNGHLVLALYNRHWCGPVWRIFKKWYCKSPSILQKFLILFFIPVIFTAKFLVTGKNPLHQQRGMEFLHNLIDWIGGYPYEYGSIQEIILLVEKIGFKTLTSIPAEVPTGCNQFVFCKT